MVSSAAQLSRAAAHGTTSVPTGIAIRGRESFDPRSARPSACNVPAIDAQPRPGELEKECIVVFDEAHNIDNVRIASLSVNSAQQRIRSAACEPTAATAGVATGVTRAGEGVHCRV
jgi:hypothetical protein